MRYDLSAISRSPRAKLTPGRTRARARVAVAVASAAAYAFYGRAKLLGWGASDAEIAGPLPGDDLIGGANISSTRAITVRRSPDVVWPWIAQLAKDAAAFTAATPSRTCSASTSIALIASSPSGSRSATKFI